MESSNFDNDNNSSKNQSNFETYDIPNDQNPFINQLEEMKDSLKERFEKIESTLENNMTNTEKHISVSEIHIRKELEEQIKFILKEIEKTELNFKRKNSESLNTVSKLDKRIETLLPFFREEIDRLISYLNRIQQLNERSFQETNNGIEKLVKNIPTNEDISKKIINEQKNLATKEQITDLKTEILKFTAEESKRSGDFIANISKEIGELKGKQGSNFMTVMGGMIFTLITLFGTIITVSNTFSNNISKPVQQIPQRIQQTP